MDGRRGPSFQSRHPLLCRRQHQGLRCSDDAPARARFCGPRPRGRALAGMARDLRRSRALLRHRRGDDGDARPCRCRSDRAAALAGLPARADPARSADRKARRRAAEAGPAPVSAAGLDPVGRRRRLRALRHLRRISMSVRCEGRRGEPLFASGASDRQRDARNRREGLAPRHLRGWTLGRRRRGRGATAGGHPARGDRRAQRRRDQLGGAASAVGEREASRGSRERVRPGRPQLHGPQSDGDHGRRPQSDRCRLPEDFCHQRLLFRHAGLREADGESADARQASGGNAHRRHALPSPPRDGRPRAPILRLVRHVGGLARPEQPGRSRRQHDPARSTGKTT